MQISGSNPTLNTLRLSLTTESQRASLLGRLSEGQTIQARVVDELSTGRWAIRFLGHTLVAESRLALKPGQVVETRVQDLGPPLTLSISGSPGSEAAAVRTALHQLGLRDDETHRAIIAALIRSGLPVDRGEVQAMRDFLAGLGENPLLSDLDDLVDRVLFLRSKGLPVTPDSVAAFWSSAPAGALGALLEGLSELLRGLDKRVAPASAKLADLLTAIAGTPGEITSEEVRDLLDRLGVDMESKLAQGRSTENLRAALMQLLTSPDLSSDQSDQIANLLRFLNTLQASSLPGDGSNPVLFQIPLFDGTKLASAGIRISRGGEDGTVDPHRLSVSITVELSALGHVRIDLSSYDGRNTCGVGVDSQHAHDRISAELASLMEGLTRSGYPVPEVKLRLESAPTGSTPLRPRIGVDFKA